MLSLTGPLPPGQPQAGSRERVALGLVLSCPGCISWTLPTSGPCIEREPELLFHSAAEESWAESEGEEESVRNTVSSELKLILRRHLEVAAGTEVPKLLETGLSAG